MSLPPFLSESEGRIKEEIIVISPESAEDSKKECAERLLEGIEEKRVDKIQDAMQKFFKICMEEGEEKEEMRPEKPSLPEFLLGGKYE